MSKETILIIEDERPIAETLLYALGREGFGTHWSMTGGEGLTWLRAQKPSLVVLDIGLPDCNGLDLCRDIRTESQVPILFLSARAEEVDRILGLELGGDDYVTKPFSPREVVARIRSILRRVGTPVPANEESEGEAPLSIGPFLEDKEKMRISYHGEQLELSRYEYRLLSLLLGRPGKVFSREEILSRAWEEPEMTMDRTVDAHIKSIRKKMRAVHEEDDPIRTVRGVGYALEL
ncbi:MAG: two-component system response regulator CreB [Myxococcales bacterium]|nr:two-component system response regulator CreB [Myxococcales bacterium]